MPRSLRFSRLANSALMATAHADINSIMCYWLPASIMIGDTASMVVSISIQDAQFSATVYPKPNGATLPCVIRECSDHDTPRSRSAQCDQHPSMTAAASSTARTSDDGGHRRLRNAGACVSLNNGNGTFQAAAAGRRPTSATTPAAGGSRSTRGSSPTSPATAAPTSSASATTGSGSSLQQRQRHVPGRRTLVVGNFGYNAGGWRVEKHPRFLADLTGDGRADIVGFGNAGVWVSRNNGNGTFQAPTLVVANFGYNAGGWRVEKHPRFLADLTGDGRADIVGFGNAGVWVSLNNGNGTFQAPRIGRRQLRLQRRRLARREAPAVPRRPDRRRPRGHRRVRQRRGLGVAATTATAPSRRRRWSSPTSATTPAWPKDPGSSIARCGRAASWLADGVWSARFEQIQRRRRARPVPTAGTAAAAPSGALFAAGASGGF